jgi:hypothetical protein
MTLEAIKEAIQHPPEDERRQLAGWFERVVEAVRDDEPAAGRSLVAAMQASPFKEMKLEVPGSPMPVRDVAV